MSVLDGPLVFVDVETTGMSYWSSRVIEVGALRVENGQVVSRLNTLVNPEAAVNPFVQKITGIDPQLLPSAPFFREIAEELEDILSGALFIAHNARFDYSFIKHEFKRVGVDFRTKMLCSVRLSRTLYPHYRRHGLDHVIERHGLKIKNRHRAYDDAQAVWQFMQIAQTENSVEAFEAAVDQQLKRPALPSRLNEKIVAGLPAGHGVYIFEDEQNNPLYVGKSVNVKKRVLSHFAADHASTKELKIAQHVGNIKTYATNGELEALLLEAQLVKDLQPLYNRKLRRTSKLTLAVMAYDEQGYIKVNLEEANADNLEPSMLNNLLGVYPTKGRAKEALEAHVKIFELCPKLLGLEKGEGACFAHQLKKCRGACCQQEQPARFNFRLLTAFETSRIRAWPYHGPVLIEEQNPLQPASSGIVVDQWCVIAQLHEEAHADPVIKPLTKRFDLDTYKILKSFLANKKRGLRIRPLSSSQVASLLAT